jgi:glycosyltransferase involved in cell wall biosynthesis
VYTTASVFIYKITHKNTRNNEPMLFSVIIPTIATPYALGRCIASIARSCDEEYLEIIVVNDCSGFEYKLNDIRPSIGCPDVKLLKNKIRIGPGESRNKGIENACGEFIVFIDADDMVSKSFVPSLHKVVSSNPDASTIQFNAVEMNANMEVVLKRYNQQIPGMYSREYLKELISGKHYVECWQAAYRKSYLEKTLGYFSTGLHEDIAFWYKNSVESRKNIYIDSQLYKKIRTEGSIINTLSSTHIYDYARAIYVTMMIAKSHDDDLLMDCAPDILNAVGSRVSRVNRKSVILLESKNQILESIRDAFGDIIFRLFNTHLDILISEYSFLTRFETELRVLY